METRTVALLTTLSGELTRVEKHLTLLLSEDLVNGAGLGRGYRHGADERQQDENVAYEHDGIAKGSGLRWQIMRAQCSFAWW